ncbi:MAG: thioesterase family protein [bacterium]
MSIDEKQKAYEIEISINPEDIDQLGHVNNIVYVQWIQDAAVAHWYAVASKKEREKLLWVVIRHEIDYKRPAVLQDTIIAHTWVGAASRRAFERHTEIIRTSDMKLLAKARTLWCPIDAKIRKPVRVSDDVYQKFSTHKIKHF